MEEKLAHADKLSNLQTMASLIKSTCGVGILSLPLAFKNAGLWAGLIIFLLVSAVAIHCMHILNNCYSLLEKRSQVLIQNYSDLVEQCFSYGPKSLQNWASCMRKVTNGFIYALQCGFCCVYIVWVSPNIKKVVDLYWPSSPDVRVYDVFVFVLLLPYVMIRSLKTLAYFSVLANLIYLAGLIITYQYILQDLPDARHRPFFKSWETLPMVFGTVVYSYENICLIVPLRIKMQNEDDFGGWAGVLSLSMVILVALYTSMGFYGYLKFGDNVAATVTTNLPQNHWLYLSANVLFAVSVCISLGLQFYVPINVIWSAVEKRLAPHRTDCYRLCLQSIIRGALLTLIFLIAMIVPHVDLLVALLGSTFGTILGIILPVSLHLITLYKEEDLTVIAATKDVLILCIGIVGFITGTYTSLVDIIKFF